MVVIAVELLLVGVFRYVTPPTTPMMALRSVQGDGAHRTWVSLDDISTNVVRAVIASEDQRFCFHRGIDREALRDAVASGGRFGGSTISNQATRNVLLWPNRDLLRKLAELPLTGIVEVAWDKRRILTVYLNIAELGRGVFGVEAAARRYWGVSAARLSLERAALLAAALPNPRHSDPRHPSPALKARAKHIEQIVGEFVTKKVTSCL